MFPFCFEWVWDMSHIVFMGGLWYALGIVGAGLTYCIVKAAKESSDNHSNGDH
jgi:hypothetical protein